MAGKSGGGVGDTVKKIFMFLVGAGVLLAVLKVFNYDPFGVIDWIWSWIVAIVTGIADFLFNNKSFRKVTSKPSIIDLFYF